MILKTNKDLQLMSELYESGKVKPIIDSIYSLENAREAFERFGSAEHLGKIIIAIV